MSRPSSLSTRDRIAEIPSDYLTRGVDVQPLSDWVLVEANQADQKIGGLWIPLEAAEAYPTSGWVIAKGPKVTDDIGVGDFVLIEEEGMDLATSYYDVFEITLKHDSGLVENILADIEVEPTLRERVNQFRRGGSDVTMTIAEKNEAKSTITFHCRDVMSWQFGQVANPSYNLTYLPVHMYIWMDEDDVPALYYILQPAKIIAVIEMADDNNDAPKSDRDTASSEEDHDGAADQRDGRVYR